MRIKRTLLSLLFAVFLTGASFGQVLISVSFAPPELPAYEQPLCPGEGYIWTPGYWAWDNDEGILLGSGYVGARARTRLFVDSRILGLHQ
jgi:hypothetical protein